MLEVDYVSYIGMTALDKKPQIKECLNGFPFIPTRRLMFGVVATYKSLRDIPIKPYWQKQIPHKNTLKDIFIKDERAINLIHYSSEEGQENTLLKDLLDLEDLTGEALDGFQINMAWPDLKVIEKYKRASSGKKIVLQISSQALENAGNTTTGVINKLAPYVPYINYALLDLSGGLGIDLDLNTARSFLKTSGEKNWNLGPVIAGGLGPNSLHTIETLTKEFPHISIDAQTKVRDQNNNFSPRYAKQYRDRALKLLPS